MSYKSRQHRRSFVRRSVSTANAEPTHFMKIILPGNIHAQNIRIPKEFVRRFENQLCTSEATIRVPAGHVWKMELKKSKNEVLLCKGWEEFVKYYSLRLGFFLMFKYEGKSQFSVIIFDSSAAEISYPPKISPPEKQKSAPERRHRKRPYSFLRCGYNTRSQRHKLDEEEEKDEEDEEEEEDIIDIDIDDDKEQKEIDRSLGKRTQRGVEATQNLESKNLPSFTAIIRPTNMKNYYICVPPSFWKVYLCKNDPITLQDHKGRKWKVDYVKNGTTLRIGKGWTSFARANSVEVGDECVFKLIKGRNYFVFQVTIN